MALSIRNSEVEALARDLAGRSGAGMTEEILDALRERKERLDGESQARLARMREIAARSASLAVQDGRSPDAILGYTDDGAF